MDTGEIQVPEWIRDPSAETHRAWKRGRRAGEDPNGLQGRSADASSCETDHENAAILQAQCSDAAAAAAAVAAAAMADGNCPPTPQFVDQELEKRKQDIWDQAQNDGIEITCEAIANMAREELEEWAAAHLSEY